MPGEWFLWTEGIQGAPFRVGRPVLGDAHCEAVWGLSTRLQRVGHETTTIATSVTSGIRPFVASTPGAFAEARLMTFLQTSFEKAEAEKTRSRPADASVPPARPTVSEPSYDLRCVRTGNEDDELCSFEAARRLSISRPEIDSPCDESVVVQGWFSKKDQDFTLLKADATLTDCDGKEVRYSSPLVLITVGSRTFIVVKEHGYEDESFVVLEVHGARLEWVLEIPGGGC